MANYSVKGYAKVYASPEDLDLWSAGITERPLPGSMVGPTFACLIGKQFHNFRFGDRLVSVLFELLIVHNLSLLPRPVGSGTRTVAGPPPSPSSSWRRSGESSCPGFSATTATT